MGCDRRLVYRNLWASATSGITQLITHSVNRPDPYEVAGSEPGELARWGSGRGGWLVQYGALLSDGPDAAAVIDPDGAKQAGGAA